MPGFCPLDLCTNANFPSSQSVVVFGNIGDPALHEVGKNLKLLFSENRYTGVDQFIKIVWENFAGEADCDPLGSVGENERKFGGESDGLLVSPVVAGCPGR